MTRGAVDQGSEEYPCHKLPDTSPLIQIEANNRYRAHVVPELSSSREVFEGLYNLRPDKGVKWRAEYHNQNFTMGNRANHFMCYAYEVPYQYEPNPEGSAVVEYVKSIIKSNVITEGQP